MLLLPHLKLLWHWGIGSLLELLDLIPAEARIVKNLPLLWLPFVGVNFTLHLLGLADDFLNPVLELNEHFLHPW